MGKVYVTQMSITALGTFISFRQILELSIFYHYRDPYLNLMGLHPDALNVFRDVQDITGFLVVQGNHPDFTNLSYFKNLIRIRGKKT